MSLLVWVWLVTMLLGPSIFNGSPVSGTDTGGRHVPSTSDCTWVLHVVILPLLKLQFFFGFSSILEMGKKNKRKVLKEDEGLLC